MMTGAVGHQSYRGREDLSEAKRIIGVVNRAAKDLAAVDEKQGIDRAPGWGKVSVKDYVQDSETGRTYSGKFSYNPGNGAKESMNIHMKGDLYDDPDFMGVDYRFARGGKNDVVYTRVDRVDFYVSYMEEARVNNASGEITYRAWKQDLTPPPGPPFPPHPPIPPYPPIPHT